MLNGFYKKMKIEHIAIRVNDLNEMIDFYVKYFDGKAGEIYSNHQKQFKSCFISFDENCRLELMTGPDMKNRPEDKNVIGIIHLAISVGSKEKVNQLTERLRKEGVTIVSNPRTTGDGYYESVIFDPEGNSIEITM